VGVDESSWGSSQYVTGGRDEPSRARLSTPGDLASIEFHYGRNGNGQKRNTVTHTHTHTGCSIPALWTLLVPKLPALGVSALTAPVKQLVWAGLLQRPMDVRLFVVAQGPGPGTVRCGGKGGGGLGDEGSPTLQLAMQALIPHLTAGVLNWRLEATGLMPSNQGMCVLWRWLRPLTTRPHPHSPMATHPKPLSPPMTTAPRPAARGAARGAARRRAARHCQPRTRWALGPGPVIISFKFEGTPGSPVLFPSFPALTHAALLPCCDGQSRAEQSCQGSAQSKLVTQKCALPPALASPHPPPMRHRCPAGLRMCGGSRMLRPRACASR